MTRSENQPGSGQAGPDLNGNQPELNKTATPGWPVQPELGAATQGSWDYNPFYLSRDLEQRLGQLEQEAANTDQRQKHLTETEQTTRARLEQVSDPGRERLVEKLTGISAELHQTQQELEKINWRINCIKAELGNLCREIDQTYSRPNNSRQITQAA